MESNSEQSSFFREFTAMARLLKVSATFVLLLAVLASPVVGQQPTEIVGKTLEMSASGAYSAKANVRFSIYRTGHVKSDQSDGNGAISITFPPGTPVRMLFVGPNGYLPELQSLAAAPGMKHELYVSLRTIQQAKQQGVDPYKHIRSILDMLEAQGLRGEDETLSILRKQLREQG